VTGGARRLSKSCEDCKKLSDPDSFARGARVKIFEAGDCENCDVRKSAPITENENVIEIYDALLARYDGFSGLKVIGTTDVLAVMRMFEVPEELWDDYYLKIAYYHAEVMKANLLASEKRKKREESVRKWKEQGLKRLGRGK